MSPPEAAPAGRLVFAAAGSWIPDEAGILGEDRDSAIPGDMLGYKKAISGSALWSYWEAGRRKHLTCASRSGKPESAGPIGFITYT